MSFLFITGLIGSLVLVTGAAWPEPKAGTQPVYSLKNWLFAIGCLLMLLYAFLGYLQGGPIFFVLLEALIGIASVLMMLNTSDKIDTPIIVLSGIGLIIWSLFLFEGYSTIIFILGLCGTGLGYAFTMGTLRRNSALLIGSVLIALFSYLEASWIFFWLNTFFALFTAYYLHKDWVKSQVHG
jgi:hypothetical protein